VLESIVAGEFYYTTDAMERHQWLIERRQEFAVKPRRRQVESDRRE
jgi:hypothetical protein